MNVLKQIDDCFINYLKIYGNKDIDSCWDDGIVVNKYIKLGNGEKKKIKKDNINNDNLTKKNEECNKIYLNKDYESLNKLNSENAKFSEAGADDNESPNLNIKKKKEKLFICDDLVEKCFCLNTIEHIEEIEDATLVRWICMVQQIISPESYLGIYKLRNKKNGETILKSSKYKDYIDTEENYEIIDDDEKKNYGEYYEINFEKYYKEKENIEIGKEVTQNMENKEEIYVNNNNNDKKEDFTDNNYSTSYYYDNEYNFKKYWKRYLFFCTNIPGNKSSWCKKLCDYSSYHSDCEIFLKNKSDYENLNKNNNSDTYSNCSTNISSYKNNDNNYCNSTNDNKKNLKEPSNNSEQDTLKENKNRYFKNNKSDSMYNKDKDENEKRKKGKMGCIIKIYDDNSQYNGENANDFLKLNDVIEVIGIYRKQQIRDYEDYKKNFNFYFFYDEIFLKYSCIHVFQYTKINYFNPLNNCILFTNELSDILENGPFKDVNELRKHLLIYISKSFSHDLLVAHYFFFYLCGSYIKESKLKLGKISLNIFNIDYEEEKDTKDKITVDVNNTNYLNEIKNESIKNINDEVYDSKKESKDAFKNNENERDSFQKNIENNLDKQEGSKKYYPKHAKKMNRMIKNLIPLYRYIPLLLEKLSSEYLVSVMDQKYGELKKGKLQLANNTYLVFDECLLQVGKLNNISLKNFQCIERIIVSQEIPFIFSTDITFETQNNILILSKKQSMFKNYVDIIIPIVHTKKKNSNINVNENENKNKNNSNAREQIDATEINLNKETMDACNKNKEDIYENEKIYNTIFSKEFYNTNENYKPSENELMQFRRYINYLLSKNHSAKILPDITNYITESFVSLRQKNKEVNQFILNSWICMSRILAFSDGYDEIKKNHWDYIMRLENERRLRMNHLNQIYI